jgi:hypothetical protein
MKKSKKKNISPKEKKRRELQSLYGSGGCLLSMGPDEPPVVAKPIGKIKSKD